MHADAIRMLLATVDTMQPTSYADPQSREIHPADLPALLGVSSQETQLILDEAVKAGFLCISTSGDIILTRLGKYELAQSTVSATSPPDLFYFGSDI